MRVREPVVAGQFYPQQAERCRADMVDLLGGESPPLEEGVRLVGGLVPHAGWAFSGAVAARVFQGNVATGDRVVRCRASVSGAGGGHVR